RLAISSLHALDKERGQVAEALDLDVPGFQQEAVVEQVPRRRGDLDPAGYARRLHPRCEVHGVAPQVELEPLRADHAGDDRATGHADPDLQRHAGPDADTFDGIDQRLPEFDRG